LGKKLRFPEISDFRKVHLQALKGLFIQVLLLCQQAGVVSVGQVSVDGTKMKANASKHKAMSYDRMQKEEARLSAEVEALLKQAEQTDEREDRELGERRGDELPEELAFRENRLKRIREAKAALEHEALEAAEAKRREIEEGEAEGQRRGPKPSVPEGTPDPKVQRNFTDPDSRIMPSGSEKGSFLQGYNCQAAVDGEAQVIVAAEVVQQTHDKRQGLPMLQQVEYRGDTRSGQHGCGLL